jgi:hypothetical protein
MSLDLTKIYTQIGQMVDTLKFTNREGQKHLQCALDKIGDIDLNIEKLKRKIADSKTVTQWPFAGLVDNLSTHIKPGAVPSDYTVLATDGSHIDVDRNQVARCYLINLGTVKINYGSKPSAELETLGCSLLFD